MQGAAEEVALVVAVVEDAEVEAEAEAEAEVEVVVTPHRLRRLDRLEEEEGGEETVFSTRPRCSNNWKRFCANNNRRPRVVALWASRPRTRSRPPIKTDNALPSRAIRPVYVTENNNEKIFFFIYYYYYYYYYLK